MTTSKNSVATAQVTSSAHLFAASRLIEMLKTRFYHAGRRGQRRLWGYTEANSEADISSFNGLL